MLSSLVEAVFLEVVLEATVAPGNKSYQMTIILIRLTAGFKNGVPKMKFHKDFSYKCQWERSISIKKSITNPKIEITMKKQQKYKLQEVNKLKEKSKPQK